MSNLPLHPAGGIISVFNCQCQGAAKKEGEGWNRTNVSNPERIIKTRSLRQDTRPEASAHLCMSSLPLHPAGFYSTKSRRHTKFCGNYGYPAIFFRRASGGGIRAGFVKGAVGRFRCTAGAVWRDVITRRMVNAGVFSHLVIALRLWLRTPTFF